MLNIFGGPFRDTVTEHAFQYIENTPSLAINLEGQKKRYAEKLVSIFRQSSPSKPLSVKLEHNAHSMVMEGGEHNSQAREARIMDLLYPPVPPRTQWPTKSGKRWDYYLRTETNRRIPNFNLSRT